MRIEIENMPVGMNSSARDSRPLDGKRILITRPREQADRFAALLEAQGAEAITLPTIQVVGPEDWSEVDRSLERLEEYDWLLFTSANGVEYFSQRMMAIRADRSIRSRIGAVGQATAARLAAWGWRADLVAQRFSAGGLLESLPASLSGLKFLFPRGNLARPTLPDGLRRRGAIVDDVVVYRTVIAEPPEEPGKDLVRAIQADLVTFTSSSSVTGLLHLLGEDQVEMLRDRVLVASIGAQTSQALRDFGLRVDIEAPVSTIVGLVDAIIEFFRSSGGAGNDALSHPTT